MFGFFLQKQFDSHTINHHNKCKYSLFLSKCLINIFFSYRRRLCCCTAVVAADSPLTVAALAADQFCCGLKDVIMLFILFFHIIHVSHSQSIQSFAIVIRNILCPSHFGSYSRILNITLASCHDILQGISIKAFNLFRQAFLQVCYTGMLY